jgi:glycosyltransferase involved in cell wall biosynthesis
MGGDNGDKTVGVVIPVIDEETALPHVLRALRTVFTGPVFVVDGGSRDRTVAVAAALGTTVLSEPRRGYGQACVTGAMAAIAAGARIVVFLDGDFSDDPAELPLVLAPIRDDRADVVVGARVAAQRRPGAMALHQVAGNALVAWLMRLLYGVPITDPGPFRALRSSVFQALALREMTYGWPVEAIVRAARHGYRVCEVPVSYRPRLGRSKISGTLRGSVLAGYRMLRAVACYVHDAPAALAIGAVEETDGGA